MIARIFEFFVPILIRIFDLCAFKQEYAVNAKFTDYLQGYMLATEVYR